MSKFSTFIFLMIFVILMIDISASVSPQNLDIQDRFIGLSKSRIVSDDVIINGNNTSINDTVLNAIFNRTDITNLILINAPNTIIQTKVISISLNIVNSSNIIIRNNTFVEIDAPQQSAIIEISHCDNISIIDNELTSSFLQNGILVLNSRFISIRDNIFINNTFTSCITIKFSSIIYIINNKIIDLTSTNSDVTWGIILQNTDNSSINNNFLSNLTFIGEHGASEGISLRFSSNIKVDGNVISDLLSTHHGSFGISITSCENVSIDNNSISRAEFWIFVEPLPESKNILCQNNIWNNEIQNCNEIEIVNNSSDDEKNIPGFSFIGILILVTSVPLVKIIISKKK